MRFVRGVLGFTKRAMLSSAYVDGRRISNAICVRKSRALADL